MKLLAMTCCCVDVFVNSGVLLPGGNALNVCADWAIQGNQILRNSPAQAQACDIALLGAIGEDVYGQAIRDTLAELAIDTSHLHTIDDITANHRICIDASGDRYFEPDAWTGGAYETFRISAEDEAFIQKADTVAMTFNDPNLPRILALRRQSAFRLAVDFQDTWTPDEWTSWLDAVDVFFISGSPVNEPMLSVWSIQHPEKDFIATRGAAGSVLFRNGQAYVQEAVVVPAVIDTTGCGDAWLAGYLMATQAGVDVRDAMQAGAHAAAVVIGHVGGFKLP